MALERKPQPLDEKPVAPAEAAKPADDAADASLITTH